MNEIYLGLMSGTSLDAIDAVAVSFAQHGAIQLLGTHSLGLPEQLRADVLTLTQPNNNEIELLGVVDNQLGLLFAECANLLLTKLALNTMFVSQTSSAAIIDLLTIPITLAWFYFFCLYIILLHQYSNFILPQS